MDPISTNDGILSRLWVVGFRVMSAGLLVLSLICTVVFLATGVIDLVSPATLSARSAVVDLFCSAMAAAMAFVGWKGVRIRKWQDLKNPVAGLNRQDGES